MGRDRSGRRRVGGCDTQDRSRGCAGRAGSHADGAGRHMSARLRRSVELLRDLDRASGWVLLVDGVEQSYVDVDDPTHLEFEYMQHMAIVVDAVLPRPDRLRALHLGGGAMAMPRWVEATRPGSRQVVVESAADVLSAVAPLGVVEGATVVVADAVDQLVSTKSGSIDLLVW